jgi:hypothetical protein
MGLATKRIITETTRRYLVLFGTQNRTFGPYLAAIHRIYISAIVL